MSLSAASRSGPLSLSPVSVSLGGPGSLGVLFLGGVHVTTFLYLRTAGIVLCCVHCIFVLLQEGRAYMGIDMGTFCLCDRSSINCVTSTSGHHVAVMNMPHNTQK